MEPRDEQHSGDPAVPNRPSSWHQSPVRRRHLLAAAGIAVGAAAISGNLLPLPSDESAPDSAGIANGLPVFVVEDYAAQDSDDAAWQRAIDSARASPSLSKIVLGTRATYQFTRPVHIGQCEGLVVSGLGGNVTTIRSAANGLGSAFRLTPGEAGRVSRLSFRNLGFDGGIANADTLTNEQGLPRVSRDEREFSPAHLVTAIYIQGDRAPQDGTDVSLASVTDVEVSDVRIHGTRGLPLVLSGINGTTIVENSTVAWCMDIGFTFCESVVFSRNIVRWSADNGVSISRGTQNVTCVGNNIEGSFYNGIWVAGFQRTAARGGPAFAAAAGADNALISSNSVTLSGWNGIWLGNGPRRVTVVGNQVVSVLGNTSTSEPVGNISDADRGNGVYVEGMAASGVDSRDIVISGNSLIDCARGGVLIRAGVHGAHVSSNTIVRPGRSEYASAEPETRATLGSYNFGISIPGATATDLGTGVSTVVLQGNIVSDDRDPVDRSDGTQFPPAEWGIYVNPAAKDCIVGENIVSGARTTAPRTTPKPVIGLLGDGPLPEPHNVDAGTALLDTAGGRLLVSSGELWHEVRVEAVRDG